MGEARAIISLASILSFRMLGLFMIYPVFALYAPSFNHANATLIGMALGVYGLTQGLLQLPLSMLSDRLGRRPIITIGLLIFAFGSMLCAITTNIYLLILGRALQGSGAIGSTLMAYASDLTSAANRTKAMALLGMTIGLSFAIALVLGPLINARFHFSGIFWFTASLALLGIAIQYLFVPSSATQIQPSQEKFSRVLKILLQDQHILKLNVSIMLVHIFLTASFAVIPLLFSKYGFSSESQWKIYLPILCGSFIFTLPILILSEKKKAVKNALLFGISLLGLSQIFLLYFSSFNANLASLTLFFTGFTLLEAMLPSLISKIAPLTHKGTAMGLFSSFQFIGIFLGGLIAGLIRAHYADYYLFYFFIFLAIMWLIYIARMKDPNQTILSTVSKQNSIVSS